MTTTCEDGWRLTWTLYLERQGAVKWHSKDAASPTSSPYCGQVSEWYGRVLLSHFKGFKERVSQSCQAKLAAPWAKPGRVERAGLLF